MERLREDVTCSICLNILNDPVSIECGHNFCRGCLLTHWSGVLAQGYQCPECRAPCSKDRMIPDTRVKRLVEKITKQLQEETEQQVPELELELGHPVQLVHLSEEGALILDEKALSHWLEQGEVGDSPICLISIIGEKRRGKSFLMNYLLRRLRSQEASEGSWMGREDEPLEGFEWRMDIERVTKGVWVWSQPFWVPAEGGKVAVLLIDTEGSMDIGNNKETSIKLSALSMLLSSYQILNIGCQVKDPDLEYLEMFLHVAEVVAEAYGLESIQHLDLLVRDWSSSRVFGDQGGKEYLRNVKQKLVATSPLKHPKTLETLKRSSNRCYLMPFPGNGIMTGSAGRLRDMDEDFRKSLRVYVTSLVGSVGQHIQRDQHGKPLSGTQLAAKIKNLSDVMKKRHFGFSSPCQMAITIHNQRIIDRARLDHAVFLREKDSLSQRRIDCLRVTPSVVEEQFVKQHMFLLERCREEMKEPEKETLVAELEAELSQEAETFLETYGSRYQSHTINQRAMDRARTDHAAFLSKKDALSQDRIECLRVAPNAMGEQCAEQRMLLLEWCRELMKDLEKETLLAELEAELSREAETFLETYGRCYQHHTINHRAMERARRVHAAFLREKDGLSQRRIDCLRVTPSVVGKQFVKQRMLLLEQCQELMMEPEKDTLLAELEAELTREAETFLETYGRRYQHHVINQRAMDRARIDHAAFLREKDGDSRNMIACLKVRPSKMAEQFAERRKQLLWRCQTDMRELAPETEALLTDLEAELTCKAEKFLKSYTKCFKKFAIEAGIGVGAVALAPVCGAVGAGIAVGAVAAEVALIGAGVGVAAGIGIGGSVGGGVGGNIAKKDIKRAKGAGSQREEEEEDEDEEEEESSEDPSDNKPLI